jgi:hypothetical protein
MAMRAYRVRVLVKPDDPKGKAAEDLSRGFSVQASNPDKAATIARARLEANGADIHTVSHAPGNEILVVVLREPRKTPPTTLVAAVAAGRSR